MPENTDNSELIEQYLQGELSGDRLAAFKNKLAADDAFRTEVALQASIVRNIKAAGRKEWALKLENIHRELTTSQRATEEETIQHKLSPVRSLYKSKFAVAAAAVVLLILSSLLIARLNSKPDEEKLFFAYYQPYPNLEQAVRSLPPAAPSTRRKAFNAYDQGNYEESIRLFTTALAETEDEVLLFYLGNAYLSAGKPAEAANTFKTYLNKHYTEFTSESKWYLSLSYLKQGKKEDAKKVLEELAAERSDYGKKAEKIIDEW